MWLVVTHDCLKIVRMHTVYLTMCSIVGPMASWGDADGRGRTRHRQSALTQMRTSAGRNNFGNIK